MIEKTMSTATEMLNLYIEAEKAVLSGKEFFMNGRRLVREDLAMIRAGRQEWERKVNAESAKQKGVNVGHSVATWN